MKIQAKQMTDSGVLFDANYKQELLSDKGRLEQKKIILKKNAELRAKELSSEKNQISNQIQNHQEQLALHRKALALSQDQLERMKDAYEKGAVARIVFEKQELETNHYTKELHNMERDLKVLSAKMQQCLLGEEIEEQKFNEQLLQLEQLQSDLQKRIIEHERMEGIAIYAPVDGHITYMNFKSGQFVRAGEHLADLQAKDDVFRAKLYIPSKSIGLMKVGLNVSMRIHAFPYAHYGTLRGKIESISESLYQGPEAKTALYVAYVVLDDQFIKGDNRIYLLKQGLTLDADIKTQEMSLVAKIFEPLNRFRRS